MPANADLAYPVETKVSDVTEDDVTLRQMMKTVTKDLHSVADHKLEAMLFEKKLSVAAYRVYLAQLYHLYEALEEELDRHRDDPVVGPIYFPDELNRLAALERDLEYFFGPEWRAELRCVPGMAEYVQHIRDLGKSSPALLVPHSYVRYFGDLSGGQILSKIFKRLYSLPQDGSGTYFYDFTHLENIKNFKELYSSRLNELELSEELQAQFAEEAKKSFELNIKWIDDLDKLAAEMPDGYLSTGGTKEKPAVADDHRKAHPCAHYMAKFSSSAPDGDSSRSAIWHVSVAMLGFAMMVTACPWMRRSLMGTLGNLL